MTDEMIVKELRRLYKSRIGVDLNLENPVRYTEKIQWSKLYDRDSMRSTLSDKYAVREWIGEKIGDEYLIPLLGVWESPDEIDFDKLPNNFVMKTNNASGTNALVKDKTKENLKRLKRRLRSWLAFENGWYLFDLQYQDIPPKIIAEKYMIDHGSSRELMDYKFMCFNGTPMYVWVDLDRYTDHRRIVFDLDWKIQPWTQYGYPAVEEIVEKPQCFDEMVQIAKELSQGFGHVRVDLYSIDNRPYFGEMTFTNGSGFEPIIPDEYDAVLGSMWKLPMQSTK